jgi:hypothetical protein
MTLHGTCIRKISTVAVSFSEPKTFLHLTPQIQRKSREEWKPKIGFREFPERSLTTLGGICTG